LCLTGNSLGPPPSGMSGAGPLVGPPELNRSFTSSHAPLLCLSASATTPGRHFAAGRVASFAEGRVGYREWVRRNGRLEEIHSLDDRYAHAVDEFMA
jgi:hypothetical protein